MLETVISEQNAGGRLDKFLLRTYPGAPRALIYKFIRRKKIKLNARAAKGGEILKRGDVLTFFVTDGVFASFADANKKTPAGGVLDILYEDENILIVNKPAPLICHADFSRDSLIGRVYAYLGGGARPALTNRLDLNTQGLCLCGKHLSAIRALNGAGAAGQIEKRYLAAVFGEVRASGVLRGFWEKNAETNTARAANSGREGAREMTTFFEPLCVNGGFSLLSATIKTGRTHQIRLQLKNAGHPILGDLKYGDAGANNLAQKATNIKITRQLLSAVALSFNTDGALAYLNGRTFFAPPDALFEAVVKKLFPLIKRFDTQT